MNRASFITTVPQRSSGAVPGEISFGAVYFSTLSKSGGDPGHSSNYFLGSLNTREQNPPKGSDPSRASFCTLPEGGWRRESLQSKRGNSNGKSK